MPLDVDRGRRGGLLLDTRNGILAGGERGEVIVAGHPEKSRLLRVIRHEEQDLEMPPRGNRLPDQVLDDFATWIRQGAHIPEVADHSNRDGSSIVQTSDHWAYQPVITPTVPRDESGWSRTSVDHFIADQHRKQGLQPSADALPEVVLRRLFFDLIGLPPNAEDTQRFRESFASVGIEQAIRALVDELLQSPQYGERWGRHWLDVARYAESSGKEANITFSYAWRYRDYVIDAFNHDLPFDQFLREQLAGDLLPFSDDQERTRFLIATGFLALGPKNLDEANAERFAADLVDEQIDAVTRVFMSSSVACARCHDHKFDPFSMSDYYALAGVFRSTKTFFGTAVSPANRVGGDPLVLPLLADTPVLHRGISATRVQNLIDERDALERERTENTEHLTLRDALRIIWRTGAIEGQLEKVNQRGQPLPLAMGVSDRESVGDAYLLLRGDVQRVSDQVRRTFPVSLSFEDMPAIPAGESGRLQMAQWLSDPRHPLTARVYVNRVWSHLMGAGLVDTVDDFGTTGHLPSHPELLDSLASQFVQSGWSTKQLIRRIVLSRAYRQSSEYREDAFLLDSENRYLWRIPKRRVGAEAMRDAMLSVSGLLDPNRPAGSLVGRVIGDRPVSLVGLDRRLPRDLDGSMCRSVYLTIMRDRLPDVLDVFDFAEPSLVTGQRDKTNVPTQTLYLMNSDFVHRCARAMAERLAAEAEDDEAFVRLAFAYCYSRTPTDAETQRVREFLLASDSDAQRSKVDCCHAFLSTVEFRVLD